MKIEHFRVVPDLVARRLRVAWLITPEAGETLADAPRLVLRRKTRDWQFGVAVVPDPYLVYDTATFPGTPGPGIAILDLPDREEVDGAERRLIEAISIAHTPPGTEWQRRIHTTRIAADGRPVSREVAIVDGGAAPLSLVPGTIYYYELTGVDVRLRATGTPATPFGLNRTLYDMLPATHRQRDVTVRGPTIESATIPEASVGQAGRAAMAGQLRRFLDPFGAALDAMRSSAEGLWSLRDIDAVDARHLPLLAEWLGWRLGDADAVPLARNELKAAPRLYRSLGSITSYRAIVQRYTGWTTRVAEFAQFIARANDPPRPPLFAAVERAGGWRSPLDIADILGFAAGNDDAAGLGALAAELTAGPGPYSLFAGAQLTVEVDRGAALVVRFADSGAGGGGDLSALTAAQLAARIGAATTEIEASDAGGRLRLRTRSRGADARLRVLHPEAELLSLVGAATDRAAVATDTAGRVHLILRDAAPTGDPMMASDPGPAAEPVGGIVAKSFAYGRWHGAARLPIPVEASHPAAAPLPNCRILVAWIDAAGTPDARIDVALASAASPTPARLAGRLGAPIALVVGGRLRLVTAGGSEDFIVKAADFVDPAKAEAPELVAALNAQLTGVVASSAPDGSLVLASVALGPQARLSIDLAGSTSARRLGLAELAPARGDWSPRLTLAAPDMLARASMARDLTAATTADGTIRLAWSEFTDAWRIAGAATTPGTTLIATDTGLARRRDDGSVTLFGLAQGVPSAAVRHAVIDAAGQIWLATDAGVARQRPDGSWASIAAAAGLAGNDTRRLALAPDGALWVATATGLARVMPGASPVTIRIADGLPSDDVRAVVVAPDAAIWIATPAGLARRATGGSWSTLGLAAGLPSLDVRGLAFERDGALWIATAAGLCRSVDGTIFTAVDAPAALAADLRDVAIGTAIYSAIYSATGTPIGPRSIRGAVWVAAPTGVWRLDADGWRNWSALDGVGPATAISTDGTTAWAATATGAVTIDGDVVQRVTTAAGLPSNAVARVEPARSATVILVAEPAAREPVLAIEANGAHLLAWSQTDIADPAADQRRLRVRRFDPVAGLWGAAHDATTPPPGARATDREPALLPLPAGGARLFFSTDRSGGIALAEVLLDAALTSSAPTMIMPGAIHRNAPVPVVLPAPIGLTLFHRADAGFTPSEVSPLLAGAARITAAPAAIAATQRRTSGTTTVRAGDAARNGRRQRWDDLLSYTPHRPVLDGEPPLAANDFYTRGTIGLYLSRGSNGRAITADAALRLQQLLHEFLPINMRAVLILDPTAPEEFVFADGFITDSFLDDLEFVERIGPPGDTSRAVLPDWLILRANAAGNVSADPLDLLTLRRRSYFPPPT
ncbi:phage tail protein [Sphingomonas faeni]|uniref:phage tail protein n=1 Tax=Sphingomonas faeni TaxID=185950 RepID=UPI00334A8914